MTNAIDNAIARLQNIAAALSTITDVSGNAITIKSAQDYPVENPEPFPCSIGYVSGGRFHLTNKTVHHNFVNVNLEFHFSRVNLKQAYQQINAVVLEFPKRLAGDPTLDGTIETLVAGATDEPNYVVRPYQWSSTVASQMLMYTLTLKSLQAPVATST